MFFFIIEGLKVEFSHSELYHPTKDRIVKEGKGEDGR
jgi:hypothetical protein